MSDHDYDTDEQFVEYLQRYFRSAHTYAQKHLERMDYIQRAFDGEIDESTWATLSEINIPLLRTAVLQVVPFIFEYLFPADKFIELTPEDENVPYSAVAKVEEIIENMIRNKMDVKRNGILTIQDAVKFGLGYGQVKRVSETHPTRQVLNFLEDGTVV